MTRAEQIDFIRELTANVTKNLLRFAHYDGIPEEWDGRELRLLIARAFRDADFGPLSRKRINAVNAWSRKASNRPNVYPRSATP